MKKIPSKHISLLSLVLMAASAAAAVAAPDKLNGKRANGGTLRAFSATAAGADQDAAQASISCIPELETFMSCTATIATQTTTGSQFLESVIELGGHYFHTIGNTSQTNPNDGIDQNSQLLEII